MGNARGVSHQVMNDDDEGEKKNNKKEKAGARISWRLTWAAVPCSTFVDRPEHRGAKAS